MLAADMALPTLPDIARVVDRLPNSKWRPPKVEVLKFKDVAIET
jgi:hypothetical protein